MMKIITTTSGKQFPIESLSCRETEASDLAIVEIQKETNPVQVSVRMRRHMLRVCVQGIRNGGQAEIDEETLIDQVTDHELVALYRQVLGYTGVTPGEAKATE